MAEAEWREIFDMFDADGSGEVNGRELVNMLIKMGKEENDAKAIAHKILQETDKNDDSRVTWEEFRNFLASCQ